MKEEQSHDYAVAILSLVAEKEAAEDGMRQFVERAAKERERAESAEARVKELEAALRDLIDAVIWMSGSDDFAREGVAGEHWEKRVRPDLERARAALKGKP